VTTQTAGSDRESPRAMSPSRPARRLAVHVIGGREDRDPAKRVQVQQIPIAAHDDVGAPVDRHLKKLVIIRIAGGVNPLHDLDDLDERREAEEQRVAPFTRHIAIELGREQLRHQLPQRRRGGEELAIADGALHCAGGR